MQLTAEQLEWIVSEVVKRLLATEAFAPSSAASHVASPTVEPSTLVVSERVVTSHTLQRRLQGVQRVRVLARAVVTPAVRDLLVDRGVQLERSP